MDILDGAGSISNRTTATLASPANDQTSYAVYEFSLWANLGDTLTFVPRDPRYTFLMAFLIFSLLSVSVIHILIILRLYSLRTAHLSKHVKCDIQKSSSHCVIYILLHRNVWVV